MNLLADPDLQAGEYVLGVLEQNERAGVERRAAEDPAFHAAIRLWERRLGPLHELIAPAAPPYTVWPQIAARLDAIPQAVREHRGFARAVVEMAEAAGPDAMRAMVRRLRRWRAAAILAGAVAVSLAALLLADALRSVPPPQHWAGVLQAESAAPAIGLSLDLQSRSLAVRPQAPPPEGQIYELWLLTGEPPSATALGRVSGETVLQPDALRRLTRVQLRNATFAVSLAPADAAPSSQPSGDFVLRGKLVGE
jgi:anti-sigma-K factor RskA